MSPEPETETAPEAAEQSATITIDNGNDADMMVEKPWKKYSTYALAIDPDQNDKAVAFKVCSSTRPHMRVFHCAWWSHFNSFFLWFSITPLLVEIRDSLNLTKEQVWTSSILGVSGSTIMRFMLGPLSDKYGARTLMSLILISAAIPTACTGLIQSANGLYILRLFIGIAGGSFVTCQYWLSMMFAKQIVGTVNGIGAGWGNTGGGASQLIIGTALFPLFQDVFFNGNSNLAWRTVCIVPAVIAIMTGITVYFISDDAPKGNYRELQRRGCMPEISASASFRSGAINFNSWILFFQYACCLGVELTMYNAAALYFADEFGQSTGKAAAIASTFGWMNIFSRGSGGYASDWANKKMGMRGRLIVQTTFLALEGAILLVFANAKSLAGSIVAMTVFCLFAQAASGSSFGIVPYINPQNTGSVSGIVGAGGNVCAIGFGLGFRQLSYKQAFTLMGSLVLVSSLLSAFVNIKGHRGILFGQDENPRNAAPEPQSTLMVPEKDPETAAPDSDKAKA
ncbi:hypothetical protein MPSEU_000580900 [Mayamaea pseudoterrestris]|nr:hypothetical protein MPSEU_000580900 [Mayamaea pseudoterrestris]